jgi:hypothetical protein
MAVTKTTTSSIQTFAKYNDARAGFESTTGPGLFVAGPASGSNTYYTSSDGFTWTSRTFPAQLGNGQSPPVQNWRGKFRVIGASKEFHSTDGITWEAAASPAFGYSAALNNSGSIRGAHKLGSEIYQFGINGSSLPFWISYAGYSTQLSTSTGDSGAGDITYFNNRWLIAQQTNSGQTVWTSTNDGQTWTRNNITSATANSGQYVSIASNATVVVALWSGFQSDYGIWSSPDGATWTKRVTISSGGARVQFVNELFLFGGDSGDLRTSTNGTTWTSRTSNLTGRISGFAWNGSVYVAVTENGQIASSPDGTTWTQRASGLVALKTVGYF